MMNPTQRIEFVTIKILEGIEAVRFAQSTADYLDGMNGTQERVEEVQTQTKAWVEELAMYALEGAKATTALREANSTRNAVITGSNTGTVIQGDNVVWGG